MNEGFSGFFFQIMQGVLRKRSVSRRREQQSCYLHSRQVMGIKDWALIKFHLSEVSLKKSFQLKVRGDTALEREETTRANEKSVSIIAPYPAFTNPPIYLFQIFRLLWRGNSVPYLKEKHYIAFTALLLSTVLLPHLVPLSMFILCTFPRDVNPEVLGANIWKHPLPAFYPEIIEYQNHPLHACTIPWLCWIKQLSTRSLKTRKRKSLKTRKRNQTGTLWPVWGTIKINTMMPWLSVSFHFARNKRKIKWITVNDITWHQHYKYLLWCHSLK